MQLVASPLLQGAPLEALQAFFLALAACKPAKKPFKSLFESLLEAGRNQVRDEIAGCLESCSAPWPAGCQ